VRVSFGTRSSVCVKSSTNGKRTNVISVFAFFPTIFFSLSFFVRKLSAGVWEKIRRRHNVAIEKNARRCRRVAGAVRGGRNDELSTKKVILNPKALSPKIKSKVVRGSGGGEVVERFSFPYTIRSPIPRRGMHGAQQAHRSSHDFTGYIPRAPQNYKHTPHTPFHKCIYICKYPNYHHNLYQTSYYVIYYILYIMRACVSVCVCVCVSVLCAPQQFVAVKTSGETDERSWLSARCRIIFCHFFPGRCAKPRSYSIAFRRLHCSYSNRWNNKPHVILLHHARNSYRQYISPVSD